MKITFLGATEEVTGSKYLVEHEDTKMLVDCGLFQDNKKHSRRNWEPLPLDPSAIDAVILTHAHIDHTGYVPLLVKNGFRGKIYCSKGTYALCAILLVDSGMLQEENAKRINDYGTSSNPPVEPLYTKADAEYSLTLFQVVDYDVKLKLDASLTVTLISSNHILGAAFVILSDGKQTLTFSGDLGGTSQLIMKSPPHLKKTDYLVLESTYGNRLHEQEDPVATLAQLVNRTAKRGGTLIIPSFAVGRVQTLLYSLYQLKEKNSIPDVPIFLDSPMAIAVTNLFCSFSDEHKIAAAICKNVFDIATFTPTVEESKKIDHVPSPSIIIAGSGMADGGRALHHFKYFISDAKNTIAFVGFQAEGTYGRSLVDGAKEIKIQGKLYRVRAEIEIVGSLSAHADYNEILEWLSHFEKAPKKVFLTHGELEAAQSLKKKIEDRFDWAVVIPKYGQSFDLD